MDSFFGHLETTLRDIGYLHATKHEMSILRRLRRIYNRAGLQQKELHLLRGVLTAVQRKVGGRGDTAPERLMAWGRPYRSEG